MLLPQKLDTNLGHFFKERNKITLFLMNLNISNFIYSFLNIIFKL